MKLCLEFLKRNDKVDLLIFKNTKVSTAFSIFKRKISAHLFGRTYLEPRSSSSIYHTALTLQNTFMHSGTASDLFLRDNLQWLGMASNSPLPLLSVLSKRGYFKEGMTILGPYLPQANGDSQMQGMAYSAGRALRARLNQYGLW